MTEARRQQMIQWVLTAATCAASAKLAGSSIADDKINRLFGAVDILRYVDFHTFQVLSCIPMALTA